MPARSSTTSTTLERLGRFALAGGLLLTALQLGACGNKGPLYLPDAAEAGTAQQASENTEQDERDR